MMIHLLLQNQNNIYNSMIKFENAVFIYLNDSNVFNIIEQQIDDPATIFYDPRLFMLPSCYQNVELLKKFKLRLQSGVSFAMEILNMVINPFYGYPQNYKQAAQYLKTIILNDKTDLQNFFRVQQQYINDSFSKFSKYFDDLPNDYDENVLQQKVLQSDQGRNLFQFIINGKKSLNYNLHFSSPIPLQKVSKDVVILINNFKDSQSILATLHESASVFDRIWFYKVESESNYTNIIQSIFYIEYISLQATLNNFDQISQQIFTQLEYNIVYVQSDLINYIIQEIIAIAEGSYYTIHIEQQTHDQQKTVKSEIVMFVFGQENYVQSRINFKLKGNVHIFLVVYQSIGLKQQQLFHQNIELCIEYTDIEDYTENQLQRIVKQLNLLYISNKDEISSVNDSIIVVRSIYRNNQFVGMLIINSYMFETFSDIIMNHMDELSATTLKMRIMERQIPIMNPFYQFSQTVSNSSRALTQTIPIILNQYPQIGFNDIASVKLTTIPKAINISAGLFIERFYEYYQLQIIQKDLTIHVGLSSTAITTKSRYAYMNVSYCTQPHQQIITVVPLNITYLRFTTKNLFKRTSNDCSVIDGYNCLIQSEVDIYRLAKQKIIYKPSQDHIYLCHQAFKSQKFQLRTDTDDFIQYLSSQPEFGNISQLRIDHDLFKSSVLNADTQLWTTIVMKYYSVLPTNHNQFLNQDSCVMVIQNDQFVKSSTFSSLKEQQTSSPLLLHILYQKYPEISHFAKYVQGLEYLLDNPKIQGVYLGHSWISGEEINIANLLEQKTFVENEIGTNNDQKVVNRICTEIARLYGTQYFVFSTNPNNNEIVKSEQLKSNIDGTNQKFRISFINGQSFLTKPLISRNKSVLGIPRVSGYLTLQLDINNVFSDLKNETGKILVMDATGSVLYSEDNTNIYAFGIKQLLIKFGYLVEIQTNTTVQSMHRSCTKNHDFWDTAFVRSTNNEFVIAVSRNISRFNDILKEIDYNNSAVYERSVVFNAVSDFFLDGFITIQEFSIFNQFLVIINNIVLTNITQKQWEMQRDIELEIYQRNIPHNIQVLNQIYPSMTSRESKIPQLIVRQPFKFDMYYRFKYSWIIAEICSLCILLCAIYQLSKKQNNKSIKQRQHMYDNICIQQEYQFVLYNTIQNLSYKIQDQLPTQKTNILKNFELILQLSNVKYIFTEQNYTVLQSKQIQMLSEDEDQINLFKQLQYQHQELHYRSFIQLHNHPQNYQQFFMKLKNLPSWIPNTFADFSSNIELAQHIQLQYVPTKRFVTVNQRNISQLVTRLQSTLQSTAQSRIHSKPVSRQEVIDYIETIPIWFHDKNIVRNNPKPNNIQIYSFKHNADMSLDQMLYDSYNICFE
ncbi:Conserved_hypothetical protein [Hexamita inflata]|uniref:Uncharacterized protein n=1 Tax=Hexamita inflata TaxID=28002 RepID=A0AA86NJG0_9EUKA|nr:Conserved hypothetical protein [Hexamita inflata]